MVKTYEIDPENLRPGVIDDLEAVERVWWLSDGASANGNAEDSEHGPDHVDVLDVLRTTTHAVRTVRNYLVTLPDDSIVTPIQPQFRPNQLSSAPIPRRQASQPDLAAAGAHHAPVTGWHDGLRCGACLGTPVHTCGHRCAGDRHAPA